MDPDWHEFLSEVSHENSSASYLQQLSAILNNAQQGDSIAEATVHREFVDKLVRVASKKISSRFKAKIAPEEVVQSVFASFFHRHRNHEFQFDSWNDLWALLLRITVCKCSDRIAEFRTLKRDVVREVADRGEDGLEPTTLLRSNGPTAEEIAIFEDVLDQLFDRLNEKQQRVVSMRLQGMSNLEISEMIGRTERSVYRIHKQIQKIFSELDPGFSAEQ